MNAKNRGTVMSILLRIKLKHKLTFLYGYVKDPAPYISSPGTQNLKLLWLVVMVTKETKFRQETFQLQTELHFFAQVNTYSCSPHSYAPIFFLYLLLPWIFIPSQQGLPPKNRIQFPYILIQIHNIKSLILGFSLYASSKNKLLIWISVLGRCL